MLIKLNRINEPTENIVFQCDNLTKKEQIWFHELFGKYLLTRQKEDNAIYNIVNDISREMGIQVDFYPQAIEIDYVRLNNRRIVVDNDNKPQLGCS